MVSHSWNGNGGSFPSNPLTRWGLSEITRVPRLSSNLSSVLAMTEIEDIEKKNEKKIGGKEKKIHISGKKMKQLLKGPRVSLCQGVKQGVTGLVTFPSILPELSLTPRILPFTLHSSPINYLVTIDTDILATLRDRTRVDMNMRDLIPSPEMFHLGATRCQGGRQSQSTYGLDS